MTLCIDPSGYADGYDLRTDRVLSLFRLLQSCRGRQVDATDHILDIGCGPKCDFPKFWDLALSKIQKAEGTNPQIFGMDLDTDCVSPLPDGYSYLQADANTWEIPDDFRAKFSLITSVYSWHWIVGGGGEAIAEERAASIYAKAEELLEINGRLAIQHLYTDDTMPEITKIAIEAMRRSGIAQLEGITSEEYKKRRALAWEIPETLADISKSFLRFKNDNHSTLLTSEYIGGSTSWHWKDVKGIWAFWKSVNLKRFFGDLAPNDQKALEKAFEDVITEKSLGKLRLHSKKHEQILYVRITVKTAHEIIRKGDVAASYRSGMTLRADLPNQVRAGLAKQITNLERNEPWFGSEGTFIPGSSTNDPQTASLLEVLNPILTCVNDEIATIFSINLRQVSTTDGSNLGQMRNVGPANADADRIQKDGDWLRQLKSKGVPTISEVVLSSSDNPPEVVVFVGSPWTNHADWYAFNRSSFVTAKDGSIPSVVILWISAKNPAKLELFEPGNVVYADYLWEIAGWHENYDIVEFLHFLLGQLRGDIKSTFLATSNLSIEGDSKRRDSVSITTFQNTLQAGHFNGFPEIADCFLLIDALQELAIIGERIRSRQQGVKSLISASSHEQKQVVDFIFCRLFNQPLTNWFNVSGQPTMALQRMGVIDIHSEYKEQFEDLRVIPSGAMLNAARSFFGLWSGTRDFLQDHLFGDRETITLHEAICEWAIEQAVGITALTDIRTRDLQGFNDWTELHSEWRIAVAQRQNQFSCIKPVEGKLYIKKPTERNVTVRTRQIWFFRAILAMLTNALKNCSIKNCITFDIEYNINNNEIRLSVVNPLEYPDRKAPKSDGTEAVLKLCVEAFGGNSRSSFRFEECNNGGIKRPDCKPTHWISEAVFSCGSEVDGSAWIFQ